MPEGRRVRVTLESQLGRQALALAARLSAEEAPVVEYLCEEDVPADVGAEARRRVRVLSLPLRSPQPRVSVRFRGAEVGVAVVRDGEHLLAELDAERPNGVDAFLDAARSEAEHLAAAREGGLSNPEVTRRYLFDCGYWEKLSDSPRRSLDTMFLAPDAARCFRAIVDFMTSTEVRQRHARFGVPYKLNVLLHGVPGTGKTSFVDCVASELGADVYIVQFTARMRDNDLAVALRKCSRGAVIVMEDVDCMFCERKLADGGRNAVTLSGLLNALDGLSRPHGSVVFLTTNVVRSLDEAVTRSRRMDHIVEFRRADAQQALAMLRAFRPGLAARDAESFCEAVVSAGATPAELHQYLFGLAESEGVDASEFRRSVRQRCGWAATADASGMYC